ncbi:MAG: hypothetical protein ABIA04_05060, partial [Pseudomonadota bacterium]
NDLACGEYRAHPNKEACSKKSSLDELLCLGQEINFIEENKGSSNFFSSEDSEKKQAFEKKYKRELEYKIKGLQELLIKR